MSKELMLVIVDDEQNILTSLRRLLRNEDYDIYMTTDYKEALNVIKGNKIKVVLSDQRMPVVSGIEFLNKVKDAYPNIIRLMFTGYADLKVAEEAINRDEVFRLINKPWDDSFLIRTIREAIERYDIFESRRVLTDELMGKNKELIVLNEKLIKLYDVQKEFTSTVSHELRTPLASIKATIDIVLSGTPGVLTEDQKNFLGKAKKNVDRLNLLINDILNLEKIESGKIEFKIERQDINRLIEDVIESEKNLVEKQGLYIKSETKDNLYAFYDTEKINQVLYNLVGNAIKFTEKGGITVSTKLSEKSDYIVVSIKDTGAGIKKEDMPKLFNKFQQLGEPSERKMGGTGLGLAICKEIITKHGGEIWVDSEYGKGSSFCFSLPTVNLNVK